MEIVNTHLPNNIINNYNIQLGTRRTRNTKIIHSINYKSINRRKE